MCSKCMRASLCIAMHCFAIRMHFLLHGSMSQGLICNACMALHCNHCFAMLLHANALLSRKYATRPCIATHLFAIRMHFSTQVRSTALHCNSLLRQSNAFKCTSPTEVCDTALHCNGFICMRMHVNALLPMQYVTRPCVAMHYSQFNELLSRDYVTRHCIAMHLFAIRMHPLHGSM